MTSELGIVDSLYEAAVVPELWKEALGRLCQVIGVRAGALQTIDTRGGIRSIVTDAYQPAYQDYIESGRKYTNDRPRRGLMFHPHKFVPDLDVSTQEEMDRDPIYTEFLRPHGFGSTAGTAVLSPTGDTMVFDSARPKADGPFSREETARLDKYWPDFARASLISLRLGLRAASIATEAMQIIGLPAATVTAEGRLVSVNEMFEALSPRIRFGAFDRVSLADRKADRLLVGALAGLNAAAVRSIPIPGGHGLPALVAHVVPIKRAAHDIFTRAAALLVVTPIVPAEAPLAELLTGLFDLTTAEARIARGVAGGMSVEAMAGQAGLSRETIRTQLKAVMAKTGTDRQAELALLLSSARQIPGDAEIGQDGQAGMMIFVPPHSFGR